MDRYLNQSIRGGEEDSIKKLLKKVPTYEKYVEILAYMDPMHKN